MKPAKRLTSHCRQISHWTAHLPSLSHIKTRNIFCQCHFIYFSFVCRAGMEVWLVSVSMVLASNWWQKLSHNLTGNKNNTAKFTWRGEPETAKVCGELGCREMEWEGLSPKLKCITACTAQCQVVRDVRTTLAGGEFLLSGLGVGSGNSSVSSPLSSSAKYKKYPTEWAHQVRTWDSSYPLALQMLQVILINTVKNYSQLREKQS